MTNKELVRNINLMVKIMNTQLVDIPKGVLNPVVGSMVQQLIKKKNIYQNYAGTQKEVMEIDWQIAKIKEFIDL